MLKRIFCSDLKESVVPKPLTESGTRLLRAMNDGWTELDAEDMTGIPSVGPKVRRPLPVPGMLLSSKGPHKHCTVCWSEDVDDSNKCLKCSGEGIMCYPAFCGSS